MSREIYAPIGETGNVNLYFRRRNASGQYWRGDTLAYEAYNAANIALYGADAGAGVPYNVLTEDGTTGDYFGDDPTSGEGTYTAYEQAGAEPAQSDGIIGSGGLGRDPTAAEIVDEWETQSQADPTGFHVNLMEVKDTPQTAGDIVAECATADVSALALEGTAQEILTDTGTTIPALIAGLTGEGAYTGVLTIDDGAGTLLEGAIVNARRGGVLMASGTTGPLGTITDWVFGAFTYDLAVRLDGYQPATDTIAVSADAWTKPISLTKISFTPPADDDQVNGWTILYDEAGLPESGATLYLRQMTDGARKGYDLATRTLTANGSGVVSGVVWADGSSYQISRDGDNWSEEFIPEDDGDVDLPLSYRFPGILGTS